MPSTEPVCGDLRGSGAGDAEVGDPGAALGVDEHVLGLEVAVDDPALVRELRRLEDLADDLDRLADGQPARDQVLERGALDVLHRDPVAAVGLAAVVDADHVRVLEPRRRLRLAAEALDELRVLGEALVQELERHPAAEHRVVGEPDVGHPAARRAARRACSGRRSVVPARALISAGEHRLHQVGRDRAGDLAAEAAGAALDRHRDRHLRVLARARSR